jgi:hypothetical protein
MTTQFLGVEAIETLRADNPAYRLREVDQTAPAGMWQTAAEGGDLLFQTATAADWSAFTDVVTLASTPAVTIHGTLTVSGTIAFAANVRLDDDIVVLFGDDSDYYMGYSATDVALEIGTGATIASNVVVSVDSDTLTVTGTVAATTDLEVASQALQCFGIQINNSAGYLRHRMGFGQVTGTTASNFIDRIVGASTAFATTPTGTDATTAFETGCKISTTSAYSIVFDTAAQVTANGLATVALQNNGTGTALVVAVDYESYDVDGVTLNRPAFYYTNADTAAAFNINSTNIPSGKTLVTRFYGHLS